MLVGLVQLVSDVLWVICNLETLCLSAEDLRQCNVMLQQEAAAAATVCTSGHTQRYVRVCGKRHLHL
jgi:hypothetical protein